MASHTLKLPPRARRPAYRWISLPRILTGIAWIVVGVSVGVLCVVTSQGDVLARLLWPTASVAAVLQRSRSPLRMALGAVRHRTRSRRRRSLRRLHLRLCGALCRQAEGQTHLRFLVAADLRAGYQATQQGSRHSSCRRHAHFEHPRRSNPSVARLPPCAPLHPRSATVRRNSRSFVATGAGA